MSDVDEAIRKIMDHYLWGEHEEEQHECHRILIAGLARLREEVKALKADLAFKLTAAKTANAEQAEQIERLTRERDTLVERWPDSTEYAVSIVVKRRKGFDLAPVAWGSSCEEPDIGKHKTKREAVRFAARLGEEG